MAGRADIAGLPPPFSTMRHPPCGACRDSTLINATLIAFGHQGMGKSNARSERCSPSRLRRGALLRDRTKSKRPTRGIALWIPVTLYILGDVLIATFTLISFIMGLNGWIGGLGIILLMGLVG